MASLNREATDKVYEAWNTGKLDLFDEVFAPDVKYHVPPFPDMDLAGYKQFTAGTRLAFPDFKMWEEEFIDVGETIITRYVNSGTFTNETPAMPVPPNGRSFTTAGVVIVQLQDGKATEVWSFADLLGMFQQLGIIPPMG